MLFDIIQLVSRAATRHAATRTPTFQLAGIRFSSSGSSLQSDQNRLEEILDEEGSKQDQQPSGDAQIQWQSQGLRRKFAPGLFIRPHYWSHEHRFEKKLLRLKLSQVGPGRREARDRDILRHFDIDPLWETSNSTLLAAFLTEMGKIRPRTQTRVSTKTQRRIAKAIRRAKMMGVIPLLSNPRLVPKRR
ncbi:hypothetical protein PAXRUDRAFT_822055 [Paxillus rubicundulus Ve08.2h10]|uniref:Small ribosomal subunit protein bS18m n=1 Tax=Paxillus rubicundulus Ve08.2h10 TaxID=930991 RepID=A0A0D0DMP2_9AGAM|nr:hypothetical protein PAXRUDRAFT_822055 [Paxillus rubicundulus Ve08.2h10]